MKLKKKYIIWAYFKSFFGSLKKKIKFLREEISSKTLIIKIIAENIMKISNLIILFIMLLQMEKNNTKSKSCSNNLSNIPEIDFNVRNNFVEDKDACSNKANFMNSNIPNLTNYV